uniref:Uncharacterized protein n=1 Tax=Anguilla anguilla TaxID=7936 RepID=A0A0E9V7N7_ANGAN
MLLTSKERPFLTR